MEEAGEWKCFGSLGVMQNPLVFGICQLLMLSKLSQMFTPTFRSLGELRAHDSLCLC